MLRQCRMKCVPGPEHGAIVSIVIVSIAIASIAHPRAHPGRGSQADLRRIVLQPGCIGPQSLTDRAVDSTTTTYLLASTLNPRTGGGRRGAHLKTRWETHLIKGCRVVRVCGAGRKKWSTLVRGCSAGIGCSTAGCEGAQSIGKVLDSERALFRRAAAGAKSRGSPPGESSGERGTLSPLPARRRRSGWRFRGVIGAAEVDRSTSSKFLTTKRGSGRSVLPAIVSIAVVSRAIVSRAIVSRAIVSRARGSLP